MLLDNKCSELTNALKKAKKEIKKKLENELEGHTSARRGVVHEMFTRTAKNLLRRDLRGAMEMGAGVYEIGQVRCLISSMKGEGWSVCVHLCTAECVPLIVAFLRVLFVFGDCKIVSCVKPFVATVYRSSYSSIF